MTTLRRCSRDGGIGLIAGFRTQVLLATLVGLAALSTSPAAFDGRRIAAADVAPHAAPAGAAQRVSFRTDDGVTLAATWYEPPARGPAVILVHMLHRSHRDFEGLASRLASEGIGALAIDLRGHGDSQGSVGSDFAPMVADVKAARRFLAGRSDVVGRVGILGASLGANLAALEAAGDPGVASLALLSPSLDYRGLRIEAALRKVGSRPVLMVVSDDDAYATRSARDLEKGMRGREVIHLSAAGHGSVMLERDPSLVGSLVDWFRRTLL